MINIDNLENFVTEELSPGERFSLRKEGWIEIITRLRQAEKDAARYRWLRDLPEGSAHEEIGNYPGDMWDAAIDEAMQCK